MKHWFTRQRFTLRFMVAALALLWLMCAAPPARAAEPIIHTVKFPAPETRIAEVEASFPTGKRATIELMMPVWSPGFYRVEDYASRVQSLSARASEGQPLAVEQPQKNRWRIATNGAARVIVSYKLLCNGRSVTTNWVGEDLLVLNGAAAFITLAERARRPHEISKAVRRSC
jgi:predicted metalloprotease with PDZ domain